MPSQRRTAVTLLDVARVAGVSRATVSRVLNDDPKVAQHNRTAVLQAAEQLGYVLNRAARSLRTNRSGSIGLVLAEPSTIVFGNALFGKLLNGIAEVLNEKDLQLTLFLPQNQRDEQRLHSYIAAGHVDGVLLTFYQDRDHLYTDLVEKGIPVVTNARPLNNPAASYVDADNEQGARLAVEHLIAQGCRTIATIAGPLGTSSGLERLDGYRHTLSQAGFEVDSSLIRVGDFNITSGRDLTTELLTARPDVDGLFVAGELMAYGALQALQRLNRRVPEDVAVVSFDDLPGAELTDPPLTSVHQPIEQIGRAMARLLLTQLEDDDQTRRRTILDTWLVERASSRRISSQPSTASKPADL